MWDILQISLKESVSTKHVITIKKTRNTIYDFINLFRENGNWNDWSMIEIEKYPCKDILEASKRERYNIELFKSVLNIIIPSRTRKEYRQDHKEIIKEKGKEYREDKKFKLKDKIQEYYENNKDNILERKKVRKLLVIVVHVFQKII